LAQKNHCEIFPNSTARFKSEIDFAFARRSRRTPNRRFESFGRSLSVYFQDMSPLLDKPKRKPGRPPSDDRMEAVLLKMPGALLAALDRHAADNFEDSRASIIRKFIVQGLKRAGMKP
jgi:hypothetical protein